MRRPAVSGSFYPDSSRELKQMIGSFLSEVEEKKEIRSGIVPHAGYIFSGKTYASVYGKIDERFDTVVVVGPNHYGKGTIDTCECVWQTPVGNLLSDVEFIEGLKKEGISSSPEPHLWEHSIEVQIPWIVETLGSVKFVPISVNPMFFEKEKMKELGRILFEIKERSGKKIVVFASSDFTHYGEAYNYVPFRGSRSEILEKIKDLDFKMIKAVEDLAVERIIELGEEMTVCGYGPIAAVVEYSRLSGYKKVEIEDYRTSFEVSKRTDAIVSYAGITFR